MAGPRELGQADKFGINEPTKQVVGKTSVRVYAGHYLDLFRVDVLIDWAFDDNGQLIDVFIRKDVDGP